MGITVFCLYPIPNCLNPPFSLYISDGLKKWIAAKITKKKQNRHRKSICSEYFFIYKHSLYTILYIFLLHFTNHTTHIAIAFHAFPLSFWIRRRVCEYFWPLVCPRLLVVGKNGRPLDWLFFSIYKDLLRPIV